jgi:hypothetical protein
MLDKSIELYPASLSTFRGNTEKCLETKYCEEFLEITTKTHSIKEKANKLDLIKIKNVWSTKDPTK